MAETVAGGSHKRSLREAQLTAGGLWRTGEGVGVGILENALTATRTLTSGQGSHRVLFLCGVLPRKEVVVINT